MEQHCCARMVDAVNSTCDQHPDRYDCPDALVAYVPQFREYGLIVHDGGGAPNASHVGIAFCPWCGSELPPSLRDEWFDELDRLGLVPESEDFPEALRSDAWWRSGA